LGAQLWISSSVALGLLSQPNGCTALLRVLASDEPVPYRSNRVLFGVLHAWDPMSTQQQLSTIAAYRSKITHITKRDI
jgi:hypothetical protein